MFLSGDRVVSTQCFGTFEFIKYTGPQRRAAWVQGRDGIHRKMLAPDLRRAPMVYKRLLQANSYGYEWEPGTLVSWVVASPGEANPRLLEACVDGYLTPEELGSIKFTNSETGEVTWTPPEGSGPVDQHDQIWLWVPANQAKFDALWSGEYTTLLVEGEGEGRTDQGCVAYYRVRTDVTRIARVSLNPLGLRDDEVRHPAQSPAEALSRVLVKERGLTVKRIRDKSDQEVINPFPLRTFNMATCFPRAQKLYELLLTRLDWVNIDWNGHNRNGQDWKEEDTRFPLKKKIEHLTDSLNPTSFPLSEEQLDRLLAVVEAGTTLPDGEWLPVLTCTSGIGGLSCSYCENPRTAVWLETNGRDLRRQDKYGAPCIVPDGNLDVTFRLSFPSGKMVVDDDLRELAPIDDETIDINGLPGQAEWTKAFAEAGLALGNVGNTCPRVWRLSDGRYTIANYGYVDTESYDEVWPEGEPPVAGISTNLWAYSLMDYDLARHRAERLLGMDMDRFISMTYKEVIEIEPGEYEFTHHTGAQTRGGVQVFATFRRVGPAKPIFPDQYLDTYMDPQNAITAQQYLAQSIRNWPTLFDMGEWESSAQRAADQLMCTLGNGQDWKTGSPVARIDPKVQPLPYLPVWKGRMHWYPQSKGYSLLFEAAGMLRQGVTRQFRNCPHLDPSFQELAYRILQNIILYGEQVQHDPWTEELTNPKRWHNRSGREHLPDAPTFANQEEWDAHRAEGVRDRIFDLVKAFRRLCRRWPMTFSRVDPEFTRWMRKRGAAEAWVRDLDLLGRQPTVSDILKSYRGGN